MVDHINNGEEGYSVREKLNTVIDRTNTLNGIENQVEANKNLSQQNKAAIEKEVQDRIDADANLQSQIDDKADSEHTHEIADVDGLQEILDNKQESGDYVTEAPDDGYQYARQFLVNDPDGEGVMTWTVVRAGGGSGDGAGAGMVIRATPPAPEDRVVGMQWLNELNGEVWIWDGARWLEFPAEGGIHKGGGGGVPFPSEELRTGQWLAYRQIDATYDPNDGSPVTPATYEWGILTTDMVSTNPAIGDPDATFKFARWGEDLAGLDNQLKVNRFIYDKLLEVEERAVNFGFVEVPNGAKVLKHDTNLLSHGGPVAQEDCLILHLDTADCTTTPCQKLVFVCPEGQEVIDHFNATQQEAIFKVVQIDPDTGGSLAQTMRGIDGGSMSGDVYSVECDQVYGETLLDGVACQLLVRTSSAITAEWVENNFVHKRGGDSMEGPLVIKAQDATDSRATKKVETLGVYSGSESSALRLGVGDKVDRIYVGQNDTSFNQPIKVSEITERHEGEGIAIDDSLIFDPRGHEIMRIRPQDGATHTITAFSNGTSNGTKLDFKLYGNTYKNAIRFFARSSAASQIAQISSDGGINLSTTLDMNSNAIREVSRIDVDEVHENTASHGVEVHNQVWMKNQKISGLGDPEQGQDAVNLRTLTSAINEIPEPPTVDLSGIESRLDGHDEDIAEINQKLEDIKDATAIGEVVYRAGLVYPQNNGDLTAHRGNGTTTGALEAIDYLLVQETDYNGAIIPWAEIGTGQLELKGGDSSYFFNVTYIEQDSGNPTYRVYVNSAYSSDGQDMQGGEQLLVFAPVAGTRSITTATLPLEHPLEVPDGARDLIEGWDTQADANQTFLLADYAQQQEIKELADRIEDLGEPGGGNDPRISDTQISHWDQAWDDVGKLDLVAIKTTSQPFQVPHNWAIKGQNNTFIHNDNNELGLYHVKTPTEDHHAATRGYVLDEIAKVEGSGGAGVIEEGHTLMGKGSWGQSRDQLSTNYFYGLDYQDRGRGVMDQYTYGLILATNFAGKYTPNYTYLPGAWVEVYNSNGELIFSQEIDSMEVNEKNYLILRWEYAPQIYRYSYTPSYATTFFVKLHEVGDPTHVSGTRSIEKLAPPEGDPFVEQ